MDTGSTKAPVEIFDKKYFLRTRETGENAGRLYFRDENRVSGQEETEDFRIRIVTPDGETIRPGDDMLLRFSVSGFPYFDSAGSDGDFIAVYDKKLLWRANIFMDDSFDDIQGSTGFVDWNTTNPGNDPVNNEWQMYIDYSDPLNPGNQLNSDCANQDEPSLAPHGN